MVPGCDHTAIFRTKMAYEELEKEAPELKKKIKDRYPNLTVRVSIKDGKLFRTYNVFYTQ